jgi:hypothetical protein
VIWRNLEAKVLCRFFAGFIEEMDDYRKIMQCEIKVEVDLRGFPEEGVVGVNC